MKGSTDTNATSSEFLIGYRKQYKNISTNKSVVSNMFYTDYLVYTA